MFSQSQTQELDNFCHNVKLLRQQSHLTKRQMAQLLGISVDSLNKLECGQLPPRLSIRIVYNIYYFFGIYPAAQFNQRLSF